MFEQINSKVETGQDITRKHQQAKMRRMAEAGFNKTSTAQALGVSRSAVTRFARNANVVFSRRPDGRPDPGTIKRILEAPEASLIDGDDYREAIQDMKPAAAVDHLLALLDGLMHQLPEMTLSPLPGLTLTRLEARLLYHLDRHARRTVSHEALMFAIYQLRPDDQWPDTNVLNVMICKIRRKLRKADITEVAIKTIPGEGFQLHVASGVTLHWRPAQSRNDLR